MAELIGQFKPVPPPSADDLAKVLGKAPPKQGEAAAGEAAGTAAGAGAAAGAEDEAADADGNASVDGSVATVASTAPSEASTVISASGGVAEGKGGEGKATDRPQKKRKRGEVSVSDVKTLGFGDLAMDGPFGDSRVVTQ